MVVAFPDAVSGNVSGALRLKAGSDNGATMPLQVSQDQDQPRILRLAPESALRPNTTYQVVADEKLAGGNAAFEAGDTLFAFTTRPPQGSPAADGFKVVATTPGNTNDQTGRRLPFTQFNALRVRFSAPVDPATVTRGESFTFVGPDGAPVDGRLTVLGRNLTFDPAEDLAPGDYELSIGKGVTSVFGNQLAAFETVKTVASVGEAATQNLRVAPTADSVVALPDNPLNGGATNLVNISSQLIGSNEQLARNAAGRGGVRTTLTEPGVFGDGIPAVIRSGQKIQLTGLSLRLGGEIQTSIASGPIDVTFANDADVYLMANDYRNVAVPTAVRLRFDLNIGTLVQGMQGTNPAYVREAMANGVFNQTVLNIQAAGLAVPQDNGDLAINAVGSFPINVNGDGDATVDLSLRLVLPAGDQQPVEDDTTPPFITAQSPSDCLYVFGRPAYQQIYANQGAPATALPEAVCHGVTDVDSYPLTASPAVTFSEPIDPASVTSESVALVGPSGTVESSLRLEGTSVVIDPDEPLAPDTNYTIQLNASGSLTDLTGNALNLNNPALPPSLLAFTTAPRVTGGYQQAPFLGVLTPGVPCALDGGNFFNGGDTAGNCTGGTINDANPAYPVFEHPANVGIEAVFSKPVDVDSIVLSDACLRNGEGAPSGTPEKTPPSPSRKWTATVSAWARCPAISP